jgi:geranylgeranyl diphosphate synthase type I
MSYQAYLDRYLPLLEAELRDALDGMASLPAHYGMMQYHMGWLDAAFGPVSMPQGKRLRPMLCLLACEAVGGRTEHALPAAAAIELVHNFSLIHDDIEDNSALRRHRATVWKEWGLAQGINCGDGMFSAAFVKLSQLPERGVASQQALSALRIMAEVCLTLTEGQHLDMAFEAEMDISLDSYLSMIDKKTAALIACATHLGALLGGADPGTVTAYARFGQHLGLAFQITDDLLGIWGQEQRIGKATSTDITSRKKTLPIVFALGDPQLRACYGCDRLTEADIAQVLAALDRRGAREFSEELASGHTAQAMDYLRQAGAETPARLALSEYAQSLLSRAS